MFQIVKNQAGTPCEKGFKKQKLKKKIQNCCMFYVQPSID